MFERTIGNAQLASDLMWRCIEELYQIGAVLCTGRAGTVIKKAINRKTGMPVAMKVIKVLDTVGNCVTRARALKEAHLLSVLDHPNIIRIFAVYESAGEVVLLLEYCDGGDLLDLLTKVGRFSEAEARRYFSEVLSALTYMHQRRIAHRDIKLDNLGLARGADGLWHIKLLDFGFGDTYDLDARMTLSCGTLEYAAPELLRPSGKIGYRGEAVDVWSAGCVLFAFVCGHLPFQSGTQRNPHPIEWPAQVQGSLRDLLAGMLVYNPRERASLHSVAGAPWMRIGHQHQRSHSHSSTPTHLVHAHTSTRAVLAWMHAGDAAAGACQAG